LIQSTIGEAIVERILRREVSKAVRGSTILYIINAIGFLLIGRVSIFFLSFSILGQAELVLEGYVGAIALYAVVVYFLTRMRSRAGRGVHFYLLGLLGLTGGGLLFIFGSIGFLSAGYWSRQFRGTSGMKCVKDNGNVVAFGQESLACTKCSRLVRIGFDLPRRWVYGGIGLLLAGIILYFSTLVVPTLASLISTPLNIPLILVFDGALLIFEPLYVQKMVFGGGYVRLPPGANEPEPS
jgi:hypothetical protein